MRRRVPSGPDTPVWWARRTVWPTQAGLDSTRLRPGHPSSSTLDRKEYFIVTAKYDAQAMIMGKYGQRTQAVEPPALLINR